MPHKRRCSGEEQQPEQQPDRAMPKPSKRLWGSTADFGPTWVTGWKTMQTPEGLLDLVLEDAYAYLDALERRKGSLLDAAPTLILRGGPGGSRREDGRAVQRFSLDLSGFSPEDVSVQLDGRKLKVTAKRQRQNRASDGCVSRDAREMYREVMLADDADLESLACALSEDGQLRIEAPRLPPPPPPERVIPIRREEAVEPRQKDGAPADGEEKKPKGGK